MAGQTFVRAEFNLGLSYPELQDMEYLFSGWQYHQVVGTELNPRGLEVPPSPDPRDKLDRSGKIGYFVPAELSPRRKFAPSSQV